MSQIDGHSIEVDVRTLFAEERQIADDFEASVVFEAFDVENAVVLLQHLPSRIRRPPLHRFCSLATVYVDLLEKLHLPV